MIAKVRVNFHGFSFFEEETTATVVTYSKEALILFRVTNFCKFTNCSHVRGHRKKVIVEVINE